MPIVGLYQYTNLLHSVDILIDHMHDNESRGIVPVLTSCDVTVASMQPVAAVLYVPCTCTCKLLIHVPVSQHMDRYSWHLYVTSPSSEHDAANGYTSEELTQILPIEARLHKRDTKKTMHGKAGR